MNGTATATATKDERAPRMSPQEERLRRLIIAFTAEEARKEIKWEINRGKTVPTAECVEAVLLQEEARELAERRAGMAQDYRRREVWASESEKVIVCEGDAPDPSVQPDFNPAPPDRYRLDARLLGTIVHAARVLLVRARVESRVRKALVARSGNAKRVKERRICEENVVTSLELPVPAVTVVRLRTGIQPVPVVSDLDFSDPLPLCQPFHFKLKAYTQHALLEHPFVSAEQGREVEAGLPGECREAEVGSCGGRGGWEVAHFTSPPAWEVHYPVVRHPFLQQAGMAFFSHDIRQDFPLPAEPHSDELFAHDVRPALLAPTSAVHELFRKPLPKLLHKPLEEDRMSDTEDEEAPQLDWPKPQGLQSIARLPWLPGLQQVLPLPDVGEGGGEGAEEKREAGVGGGSGGPLPGLVPSTLPIHSHDSQKENANVAKRLQEYDAMVDQLIGFLPPHLQKIV